MCRSRHRAATQLRCQTATRRDRGAVPSASQCDSSKQASGSTPPAPGRWWRRRAPPGRSALWRPPPPPPGHRGHRPRCAAAPGPHSPCHCRGRPSRGRAGLRSSSSSSSSSRSESVSNLPRTPHLLTPPALYRPLQPLYSPHTSTLPPLYRPLYRTRGPDLLQVRAHGGAGGDLPCRLPQRLHLALQVRLTQRGLRVRPRRLQQGWQIEADRGRRAVGGQMGGHRRQRRRRWWGGSGQSTDATVCFSREGAATPSTSPSTHTPASPRPHAHVQHTHASTSAHLFVRDPLAQLLGRGVAVGRVHLGALPAVIDDDPAGRRAARAQALQCVRQARGADRRVKTAAFGRSSRSM